MNHLLFCLTFSRTMFPPNPIKESYELDKQLKYAIKLLKDGRNVSFITAGGQVSKSVAPSPIMITFLYPCAALSCSITFPLPPDSDVSSCSSKPSYSPCSSNRSVFANTLLTSMLSDSATGLTIFRKPPETK